ncbi:carbohydrate ABC transporter membrane protein 1, CUT1 family [Rhizobiales bacterium GAS113]|nr:carbohydrate ABC transporter membrane protein 1, CUT1 family [Rhizobiales bacterium GAS113]
MTGGRLEAIQEELAGGRRVLGRWLIWLSSLLLLAVGALQVLDAAGAIAIGFSNWRPFLYMFLLWGVALGAGQVLARGETGKQTLFLLPALLFTFAMVIFPTLFGIFIAFTDWNLNAQSGHHFNGLENIARLLGDPYFWNALGNMVFYVLTVVVQYVIAFSLALLLNAEIRARKFFRVSFLLPFMLSPVAVSWMIGKSIMENRFGPAATLARYLGWESPAFFTSPWIARTSIMVMDSWVWIPFIVIMLLAGLQALPIDIKEAAKVDGANRWQSFWKITFPLMLPVSVTAVVLRIIFELKLADIVINVTAGGPGGATDTISSFIYREYRDRSNVGYGTMLAEVYLVIIIVFVTLLLKFVGRYMRKMT